jgi:dihydropteroate synthase
MLTPVLGSEASVRIGGREFRHCERPHAVGIVNLSPESPNADSVAVTAADAVARARWLAAHGASVIDVGARSSNYKVPDVSWRVELARLVPAVEALKEDGFLVSIDTWSGRVARSGARAGADVINDSDGFQDPEMIDVVGESGLPVVIPFLNGPTPRDHRPIDVTDPVGAMLPWFETALARAEHAGVSDVLLDPGVGYQQPGATEAERVRLQRRVFSELHRLRSLGRPLFAAVMRKAMPALTVELTAAAIRSGVDFLRAHDPEVIWEAVAEASAPQPSGSICRQ